MSADRRMASPFGFVPTRGSGRHKPRTREGTHLRPEVERWKGEEGREQRIDRKTDDLRYLISGKRKSWLTCLFTCLSWLSRVGVGNERAGGKGWKQQGHCLVVSSGPTSPPRFQI